MSTSILSLHRNRVTTLSRIWAYAELTKPRIVLLVLATVAVSGLVASWGQPNPIVLIHAVVGTALVAASGSALNQWLERGRDARMSRTCQRPLPSGILTGGQVLFFAGISMAAGMLYFILCVDPITALVALVTWTMYVWVYTPLKAHTVWNTTLGAIAGALPVFIGWFAVTGWGDLRAIALFLVVFLWQFPHFMAIAWIYRREYEHAGMKMLTVIDPSGRRASLQAVSASLTLIPVSFFPAVHSMPTALPYVFAALLLGVGQLACALAFCGRRDEASARRLLRASLIYLPSLLIATLFIPLL